MSLPPVFNAGSPSDPERPPRDARPTDHDPEPRTRSALPGHQWLDQTLRRGCRQNGPGGRAAFEAWDRLRPGWLTQAAQEPQGLVVLLAASMHHSGYVRQAAVQLLARWSLQTPVAEGLEAGAEVPFVLLRLNDWVGPVQQAAGRLIKESE